MQHLPWGDVIHSTYTSWTQCQLPLQMLMSLEIPSKDYAYQWVMISGHLKDAILNVFHSLRATFGQFLRIHGLYQLLPGYAFFKTLTWAQLATLRACFFLKIRPNWRPRKITWSSVSQDFDATKAQTDKIFRDLMVAHSWFPGGLATKVMQWMVANRIHGSRHLGVETTYSKATLEGFENSLKVLWSFSFLYVCLNCRENKLTT